MTFIRQFYRYITVIYILTILTVVVTSYITLQEFFEVHNKRQQEAIIPLFSLVTSEILRPLAIANYMANDQFLIDYAQQEKVNKSKLLEYLQRISISNNMVAFIALEHHNLMIDSSAKETSIQSQDAEWFYRLKNINKKQFTDIGNAEDPHLYFDVKVFNNSDDFLGFTGVGIDLNYFAKMFKEFHQRFGFELYFVDEHDMITLTSSYLMKTESHHRKNEAVNINSLSWYKAFSSSHPDVSDLPVASIENNELIVSQVPLKELNWRMFIVAPPATQQSEYWLIFFQKFTVFIIISFLLYFIFNFALSYFKTSLVKDSETDFLTKLPNRNYIHWKFDEIIQEHTSACIVIADIDNFKQVNDTYGHLIGDDVLKIIAQKLTVNLRQFDLSARWGGEEFIMILPDTNIEQAKEITERIRKNIADIPFQSSGTSKSFTTTVSFGIAHSLLEDISLEDIIEKADKALYQAKNSGRNKVMIHTDD